MSMDTTCLYSVVRNTSGQTKNFPFLPPHGKELDDQEEYSVWGSVLEAVNRGDRSGGRFQSDLDAALENDLEIRTLPKPILTDESQPGLPTKMITLTGGSLVLEDPCWESLSLA